MSSSRYPIWQPRSSLALSGSGADPFEDQDLDHDEMGTADDGSPFGQALLGAIYRGDPDMIRSLAQASPALDLNAAGPRGRTPLQHACWLGSIECARALLDLGASPEVSHFPHQASPMALAACSEEPTGEIIRLLASRGARVESRDPHGRSPFLLACSHLNLSAAQALFELGADARALNEQGQGALALAREAQQKELLDLMWGSAPRASQASLMLAWLGALFERHELERLSETDSGRSRSGRL